MLPQRAVFHAEAAIVLQEHHAVAGGEVPARRARLVRRTSGPRSPASRIRSRAAVFNAAHLFIGMGQDDAAGLRVGLPGLGPSPRSGPRAQPRGVSAAWTFAVGLVSRQRRLRPARRQITRRLPLPVLALAADLADPRTTVAVVEATGTRPPASIDCSCCGITDQQPPLGPGVRGEAATARVSSCRVADHAGFRRSRFRMSREFIAFQRIRAPLRPAVLQAREGAGPDARFRPRGFSAAIPESAAPRTRYTVSLPRPPPPPRRLPKPRAPPRASRSSPSRHGR